jgi:uncharacterized protein (DUF2252 family)
VLTVGSHTVLLCAVLLYAVHHKIECADCQLLRCTAVCCTAVCCALSQQARVPKTEEEAARIAGAVAKVFLFRHLSPAQMTSVVQVSKHTSYCYYTQYTSMHAQLLASLALNTHTATVTTTLLLLKAFCLSSCFTVSCTKRQCRTNYSTAVACSIAQCTQLH